MSDRFPGKLEEQNTTNPLVGEKLFSPNIPWQNAPKNKQTSFKARNK